MEQIIKEQKEHSQMLTYMFKEQEEQGCDLRELKRQKFSLEESSTPRIRGTPISQNKGIFLAEIEGAEQKSDSG
ncbi:uncharacterized protein DS421_16g549390 [Arachis hypogaea]|nr:uncharacterized protein DS421_16g549390 [Arachis hypogaea]